MNKKRAFTLIEILVVAAIIAMLASIMIVNLMTSRAKARDAKRKEDMKTISSALELYYDSENAYPASLGTSIATASSTYLAQVPQDPLGSAATVSQNYDYDYDNTKGYAVGNRNFEQLKIGGTAKTACKVGNSKVLLDGNATNGGSSTVNIADVCE